MIPHVDLRLQDCAAEVWLNDIPLMRLAADDAPKFATKPVAEFVRSGENTLTVVPFPGDTPSTSRQSQPVAVPPGAKLDASLVFYQEGEFPGSGAGRAEIAMRFGAGARPLPARAASETRTLVLQIPPWAWETATPWTSQPGAQQQLGRAAAAVHDAFAKRNADFFLAFGRPYFEDYARAYPGMSPQRREQRFRAGFAASPGEPPWAVKPLDPANFDFRSCADGRLLELVDNQYRPILWAESTFYPLPVMIGIVDGRIQILR